MQYWILLICCAAIVTGCESATPSSTKPSASTQTKPIITPDLKLTGKVVMVNSQGRFVVASFPLGSIPEPDERLNVYHNGLKVGEIKVGDWKKHSTLKVDNNIVADLTAGEAQVSDEVREN